MTFRSSIIVALSLLAVACGNHACRCHTGHSEVQYHKAYDTQESQCIMYDNDGDCAISMPYTEHHPARCSKYFVCDLRCNDFDKGKAESHERHEIRSTPLINNSPQQCSDGGYLR